MASETSELEKTCHMHQIKTVKNIQEPVKRYTRAYFSQHEQHTQQCCNISWTWRREFPARSSGGKIPPARRPPDMSGESFVSLWADTTLMLKSNRKFNNFLETISSCLLPYNCFVYKVFWKGRRKWIGRPGLEALTKT